MKAHIVYAHPNEKSFNNAILKRVEHTLKKHQISFTISDLYSMNFNPVLNEADRTGQTNDIKVEQQKISNADWIIMIYPVWWTQMPAILKGYIDRVFAYGFAFRLNENGPPIRLLNGKKGVIISTFSHPYHFYEEEGYISAFEKTIDEGVFNFVGIDVKKHFHLGSIIKKSNQQRTDDLASIEKTLSEAFVKSY